jgi:hypothetical protein
MTPTPSSPEQCAFIFSVPEFKGLRCAVERNDHKYIVTEPHDFLIAPSSPKECEACVRRWEMGDVQGAIDPKVAPWSDPHHALIAALRADSESARAASKAARERVGAVEERIVELIDAYNHGTLEPEDVGRELRKLEVLLRGSGADGEKPLGVVQKEDP